MADSDTVIPGLDAAADLPTPTPRRKKSANASSAKGKKAIKSTKATCKDCGPKESNKWVGGRCSGCYAKWYKQQRAAKSVECQDHVEADNNSIVRSSSTSKSSVSGGSSVQKVSRRRDDYSYPSSVTGSLSPTSGDHLHRQLAKFSHVDISMKAEPDHTQEGRDITEAITPFLTPPTSLAAKRSYADSELQQSTERVDHGMIDRYETEDAENNENDPPAKIRKLNGLLALPSTAPDPPGDDVENEGEAAFEPAKPVGITNESEDRLTDTNNAADSTATHLHTARAVQVSPLTPTILDEEQEAIITVQTTLQGSSKAYSTTLAALGEAITLQLAALEDTHKIEQRATEAAVSTLLTTFGNLQSTRDDLVADLKNLSSKHVGLQAALELAEQERDEWRTAKKEADAKIGLLQEDLEQTKVEKDAQIKDLTEKWDHLQAMVGQFSAFMPIHASLSDRRVGVGQGQLPKKGRGVSIANCTDGAIDHVCGEDDWSLCAL